MKMKLKKLFKYGLMTVCLLGNAVSMEDNSELLIVGCKPWDLNIQEVNGLETAHFVDFMLHGAPEVISPKFHHLDLNDTGIYSAGKFSEFAVNNPGSFNTIIIDWMTYHHIGQNNNNNDNVNPAWESFATLLKPDGQLIVPVTLWTPPGSEKRAQEVIDRNKLTTLFSTVNIRNPDSIPSGVCSGLLRRSGIGDCALSSNPAIIFATKGP